ncbi:unnamed protein product [Strongylus vulgaris]|uniref:Uncharacterized protein n=1 Tax=Strongylus vulgaris TaxID=40348 RepID=A0A3P7JIY5_STRVU|nr:unnamed protein product [Strongylus vulgaris]
MHHTAVTRCAWGGASGGFLLPAQRTHMSVFDRVSIFGLLTITTTIFGEYWIYGTT